VRPMQRGQYRLYTLRLQDRSGALPDGAKYQRLDLRATQGVAALGAYTVVASSESILVLGAERGDK